MAYAATPIPIRFSRKFIPEPNSGCWLWEDAPDKNGYGLLIVGKTNRKAHRISWQIHRGPIPTGLMVCHRCDNPPCVNPEHLFLGTALDNNQDMVRKGRARPTGSPKNGALNGRARINDEIASAILRSYWVDGEGNRSIAVRMGLTMRTVQKVSARETWTHLPHPLAQPSGV